MKIIDEVWMLVKGEESVVYCIGTSAQNVWQRVIEEEIMGTVVTKEDLKAQGYVAKKVGIALLEGDKKP